jgi:hypothetical protein
MLAAVAPQADAPAPTDYELALRAVDLLPASEHPDVPDILAEIARDYRAMLSAAPAPEGLRERFARIIDPSAFLTLRQVAAAAGLDAANPPAGVVVTSDIDAPIPNREPARETAFAMADAILSLLSQGDSRC